ncbi:MAG: hypothetical protein IJG52_02535 [Lachnospiraceae bacterium]|nr:hypothetical protein [Lachnospiraceae bacterium]
MALNPMEIMKLGDRLRIFREQHPRVESFIRDNFNRSMQEGTVIEMKVTKPDGRTSICNFRVSKEDLETVEILRNIKG